MLAAAHPTPTVGGSVDCVLLGGTSSSRCARALAAAAHQSAQRGQFERTCCFLVSQIKEERYRGGNSIGASGALPCARRGAACVFPCAADESENVGRSSHRSVSTTSRCRMPQMLEELVETIQPAPQERRHQRIVDQVALFAVSQVVDVLVEMNQITSQERVSERNVTWSADVLLKELVEVGQTIPRRQSGSGSPFRWSKCERWRFLNREFLTPLERRQQRAPEMSRESGLVERLIPPFPARAARRAR